MNGPFASPQSLSTGGPHFTAAHFNFDHIERPWRWAIEHVAVRGIKRPFMTRTLQPFVLTFVIHRTREMSALLPVRMKFARFRTNQNCRIFLSRIIEVECRVEPEARGSFDSRRRQTRDFARI